MRKNTSICADQTFTQVKPDYVIEVCTKLLNQKLEDMQKLQEPRIQQQMKNTLFKGKESREAVIERLYGKMWTDYAFIRLSGDYEVSRTEELMSLAKFAKQSEEMVYLYPSDAKMLEKFM